MLEDAYETSAVIDDAVSSNDFSMNQKSINILILFQSRCFDKNDTNLFGENKFVQDECQKAIDELK